MAEDEMMIDLTFSDDDDGGGGGSSNDGPRTRKAAKKKRPLQDENSNQKDKKRSRATANKASACGAAAKEKRSRAAGQTSTGVAAVSRATAKDDASTAKLRRAYLREREAAVRARSFPVGSIKSEQVPTGRTIKPMTSWKGTWPAVREFFQNTIDHLGLLDYTTGRRHKALDLRSSVQGDSTKFEFMVGDEAVCTIVAMDDELFIEQLYTFPLPPRALDTGVPDTTKSGGATAGGFGDGFKTAAVALLAQKEFESLVWTFHSGGETITWHFEGKRRERIGTFAACRVLEVRIERGSNDDEEEESSVGRAHIMRQRIRFRGIGARFLAEAVPRLQVFWTFDESALITSRTDAVGSRRRRGCGGDFLCDAATLSGALPAALGAHGLGKPPEAGVYIKGIYVRKSKIEGCVMSFFGNELNVTGRDRNDVDDDDCVSATLAVLKRCTDRDALRVLLQPLCGKAVPPRASVASVAASSAAAAADADQDEGAESGGGVIFGILSSIVGAVNSGLGGGGSSSSGGGGSGRSLRRSGRGSGKPWLLRSPRFLNRVLELDKEFFLREVFGFPRGCLFVSNRTLKSSDHFIKWAAGFLRARGAPLVALETGSNRVLFEEVNEATLTERCVTLLTAEIKADSKANKNTDTDVARKGVQKLLGFLGLAGGRRGLPVVKVHFHAAVQVAFVHRQHVFLPLRRLTRDLCVKVLNVVQGRLGASSDGAMESYSALIQSMFERVDRGDVDLTLETIDTIIAHAKGVRQAAKQFLARGSTATAAPAAPKGKGKAKKKEDSMVDLTFSDEEEASNVDDVAEGPSDVGQGGGEIAGLDQRINSMLQHLSGTGGEDDIIPRSAFAKDGAGEETCLRPNSQLVRMQSEGNDRDALSALGGGELWADAASASQLRGMTWSAARIAKVRSLRAELHRAVGIVRAAVPRVAKLLDRVHDGYDHPNTTYDAFCDGGKIVVNLATYSATRKGPDATPAALRHDLVITVTHELAHMLERSGGHGQAWRDTHMALMQKVYIKTCFASGCCHRA